MDNISIEFEPLSHEHPVRPARTSRARMRAGCMAIGLAVVATGTLGVLVARNDAEGSTSADQPVTEDRVATLPPAADANTAVAVERYRECLPLGAGSADAMERRALNCRRALEAALSARIDPTRVCPRAQARRTAWNGGCRTAAAKRSACFWPGVLFD